VNPEVRVEGLKELQAALRRADPKLPRELTKAHKEVSRTVVEEARKEMGSQPVPKAAEAAAGLVPRAGQKWAGVALAGDNPYVRAVEFGALTHVVYGRRVLASQMKRRVYRPWKGNQEDAGYALYPTIRRLVESEKFFDPYLDALNQTYREAFPSGNL
jgi:hypothetical protein